MEFKAAPDYETMKLMLIIAGSILVIMLGVIGFLIKYLMKEKEDNNTDQIEDFKNLVQTVSETVKEQSKNVKVLGSTVEGLKGVVAVIKSQQHSFEKLMSEKFQTNVKRLDAHADDIREIDKRLVEVETTCKIKLKTEVTP